MVFCLALSTVSLFAGAVFEIVDPAPIVAPFSIVIGATNSTPEPIKTLLPIMVLCLSAPS
jgi:hypothetical protein